MTAATAPGCGSTRWPATGIGMCAHLAEDLVRLDSWGYPVVPQRDLDPDEARHAARAVTGCPRRALRLAHD